MKKAHVFLASCLAFSIAILVYSRDEKAGITDYSQKTVTEKQRAQTNLVDPIMNVTAKTSTSSTVNNGSTTR